MILFGLLVVPVARALNPSSPQSPTLQTVPGPSPSPGAPPISVDIAGSSQSTCTPIYINSVNFTGSFYSAQGGAEAIDDLHMIEGGGLCSFTFGYNEPGPGPVDATITFYNNDAGDSPPGGVAAGPYMVTGLPSGANSIVVTVPSAPVLGSNIWMGVRFSNSSAGLLISDPPTLGTSHDYFYENGNYLFFGGNPRANFFLDVEVELAVPAEPSTWGSLKGRSY